MNCMKWTWYLPEKTSMPPCAAVPMAVEKTSPKLEGEDDFYELLMASLEAAEKAE